MPPTYCSCGAHPQRVRILTTPGPVPSFLPPLPGVEVLLDGNARSPLALVLLVLWSAVWAADMLWGQIKQDATLGHLLMGERHSRQRQSSAHLTAERDRAD
jgi:hypothetical protein